MKGSMIGRVKYYQTATGEKEAALLSDETRSHRVAHQKCFSTKEVKNYAKSGKLLRKAYACTVKSDRAKYNYSCRLENRFTFKVDRTLAPKKERILTKRDPQSVS